MKTDTETEYEHIVLLCNKKNDAVMSVFLFSMILIIEKLLTTHHFQHFFLIFYLIKILPLLPFLFCHESQSLLHDPLFYRRIVLLKYLAYL